MTTRMILTHKHIHTEVKKEKAAVHQDKDKDSDCGTSFGGSWGLQEGIFYNTIQKKGI